MNAPSGLFLPVVTGLKRQKADGGTTLEYVQHIHVVANIAP